MAPEDQQPYIDPIGHALLRLAECFPSGASAGRKSIYYEELRRRNVTPDEVREAVNRLIESHDKTTFPPFRMIFDRIVDIRRQAQGAAPALGEPRRDTSPAGIALDLERFRLYREMDMPAKAKPERLGSILKRLNPFD